LLKVQLALHRAFCNFRYLRPDTRLYRQLVNHFLLNQGRVHVKADQAPGTAEEVVLLESDIGSHFCSQLQKLLAHGKLVADLATDKKLDTGLG
jgi:hypothetical protein